MLNHLIRGDKVEMVVNDGRGLIGVVIGGGEGRDQSGRGKSPFGHAQMTRHNLPHSPTYMSVNVIQSVPTGM